MGKDDEDSQKPVEASAEGGGLSWLNSPGFANIFKWIVPIIVFLPLVVGLFNGSAKIDLPTGGGADIVWRFLPVLITVILLGWAEGMLQIAGGKKGYGALLKLIVPICVLNAIASVFISGTGAWTVTLLFSGGMVGFAYFMLWRKKKDKYKFTKEGELTDPEEKRILDLHEAHKNEIERGLKDLGRIAKTIKSKRAGLDKALTVEIQRATTIIAATPGVGIPPQGSNTVVSVSTGGTVQAPATMTSPFDIGAWENYNKYNKHCVFSAPLSTLDDLAAAIGEIAEEKKKTDRGYAVISNFGGIIEKASLLYAQACTLVWEKYYVRWYGDLQTIEGHNYWCYSRYTGNEGAKNIIADIIGQSIDALKTLKELCDAFAVKRGGQLMEIGKVQIAEKEVISSRLIEDTAIQRYKQDGPVGSVVTSIPQSELAAFLDAAITKLGEYAAKLKKEGVHKAEEWIETFPCDHPLILKGNPIPGTSNRYQILPGSKVLQ